MVDTNATQNGLNGMLLVPPPPPASVGGAAERLGPRRLINRVEYIRLIQQALYKLGYEGVAKHLEADSGTQMQPPQATEFQRCVLAGEWSAALQVLPQLTTRSEVLKDARFLILQQKYLEALEAQDYPTALKCLRTEMAPLQVHEQQLHHLAGLLLWPPSSDALSRAAVLGGGREQRARLLGQLQAKLPPSLLIPDARLEALVEQALAAQVSRCQYHNASEAHLSLFCDYQAGVGCLPTQLVQVLDAHRDEVWHLAFSHGGTMLATASKDKTARLWSIRPGTPGADGALGPPTCVAVHVLAGHQQPVAFVAWSPDDRLLLTCSDEVLRLWDVASGALLHTYTPHRETITACTWLPDSKRIVSGSVDKWICMYDTSGAELQRWRRPYRVQDMVATHNGTCLVIACSDRQIHILRLSDHREVVLQEAGAVTSIALSPDSQHLLVSLQDLTVHRWYLGAIAEPYPQPLHVGPDPMDAQVPTAPAMKYRTQSKQSRFVLRSTFGGSDGTFVVHGSEDCQVYLWHRDSGELLLRLEGHSGIVNAVSWSAANPYMLASASDDRTVRIWLAAAALQPAPAYNAVPPAALPQAAVAAAAPAPAVPNGVHALPPH